MLRIPLTHPSEQETTYINGYWFLSNVYITKNPADRGPYRRGVVVGDFIYPGPMRNMQLYHTPSKIEQSIIDQYREHTNMFMVSIQTDNYFRLSDNIRGCFYLRKHDELALKARIKLSEFFSLKSVGEQMPEQICCICLNKIEFIDIRREFPHVSCSKCITTMHNSCAIRLGKSIDGFDCLFDNQSDIPLIDGDALKCPVCQGYCLGDVVTLLSDSQTITEKFCEQQEQLKTNGVRIINSISYFQFSPFRGDPDQ